MPFKFLVLFYDLTFFTLEAFIFCVLKCHKDVPLFFYCLDTWYALQSEGLCPSVLGRFLVLLFFFNIFAISWAAPSAYGGSRLGVESEL